MGLTSVTPSSKAPSSAEAFKKLLCQKSPEQEFRSHSSNRILKRNHSNQPFAWIIDTDARFIKVVGKSRDKSEQSQLRKEKSSDRMKGASMDTTIIGSITNTSLPHDR